MLLRFSFLKITRTNVSHETFLSFAFYGEEKILRRCYTKSGFLGEVHYGSDPYWFIFGGAAVKNLAAFGEKMKWEVVGAPVEQKQALKADKYEECWALGEEMARKLKIEN